MANETLVAALDRLTGDVVKGKVPRKIKTGVNALEELSEPLVIIVDGADYIARCDEAGLAASLKSIAIEWHVPIFCGVTSFDLDSFLNIALLCDEAVYLQNQGGGNVVMRLVKSRTRACRDAQSIETRFDAKTLTFGHDVGEKHAE